MAEMLPVKLPGLEGSAEEPTTLAEAVLDPMLPATMRLASGKSPRAERALAAVKVLPERGAVRISLSQSPTILTERLKNVG